MSELPKNKNFIFPAVTKPLWVPSSYEEAISCPEAPMWIEAMNREYDSIMLNNVWELVDPPADFNIVETRWVYRKKVATDSTTIFKARLVAQGFTQIPGVDFDEVFSPVIRHSTLRTLLALAVQKRLSTRHLDVTSAFLHGDLDRKIFLKQPTGFTAPGNDRQVCQLRKAIYGLRQGGKVWYDRLREILLSMNMTQSTTDPCLYFCVNGETVFIVGVFVDDLPIFYSNPKDLELFIQQLQTKIKIRDLGPLKKCLGVNIDYDEENRVLKLHQRDYINEMLREFHLEEAESSPVPMEPGTTLLPDVAPKTDAEIAEIIKIPYQNAVGKLMYLVQMIRPDIAYAVSVVSRFNLTFSQQHWKFVKQIMRYLKGTSDLSLTYSGNSSQTLSAFCDASFAGEKEGYKSQTGYVFLLQGGAVSWRSCKQSTVTKSTTEAELQAIVDCTSEAIWMKNLIDQLSSTKIPPIEVSCDNKGAVDFSKNGNFSHGLKHVMVHYHFVKEKIEKGYVNVEKVPADKMVADCLTKPLQVKAIKDILSALGLTRGLPSSVQIKK